MTFAELDKRNRTIVQRIDAGESWKRVAQEYGLSKSRLGQILLRQRGPIAEPNPLSAEEKMWAVLLAADGVCVREIARLMGRHKTSIRRALKANNVKASSGVDFVGSSKRSQAVELVRKGYSYSEVAEMIGVTRNVVAGAVHRWKEKKAHDGVPKLSKLQPDTGAGQPAHRRGAVRPATQDLRRVSA